MQLFERGFVLNSYGVAAVVRRWWDQTDRAGNAPKAAAFEAVPA